MIKVQQNSEHTFPSFWFIINKLCNFYHNRGNTVTQHWAMTLACLHFSLYVSWVSPAGNNTHVLSIRSHWCYISTVWPWWIIYCYLVTVTRSTVLIFLPDLLGKTSPHPYKQCFCRAVKPAEGKAIPALRRGKNLSAVLSTSNVHTSPTRCTSAILSF